MSSCRMFVATYSLSGYELTSVAETEEAAKRALTRGAKRQLIEEGRSETAANFKDLFETNDAKVWPIVLGSCSRNEMDLGTN